MKPKLVIGLTGPIAGGKGAVGDYLKEKGFFYTSTSDRVREELARKKEEITRDNLQKMADQMRRNYGPEVLARRSWKVIEKERCSYAIIDSIRGEAEVDFLKTKSNFYLLGITAPRALRFQRLLKRQRESDPQNWKDFLEIDRRDFKSGSGKFGRNLKNCLKKADYVLINKGTIKELEAKVEEILTKIDAQGEKA